jgi:hypothetical protein
MYTSPSSTTVNFNFTISGYSPPNSTGIAFNFTTTIGPIITGGIVAIFIGL